MLSKLLALFHLAFIFFCCFAVFQVPNAIAQSTFERELTRAEKSIESTEYRLSVLESLKLEQRLSVTEEKLRNADEVIKRIIEWQEKVQYALLILVAESIIKVYGTFANRRKSRVSEDA